MLRPTDKSRGGIGVAGGRPTDPPALPLRAWTARGPRGAVRRGEAGRRRSSMYALPDR